MRAQAQGFSPGVKGVRDSTPAVLHPRRTVPRVAVHVRSGANVAYSAKDHIIWCPKYRRRVLIGEVEIRLVEIVLDGCAEGRAELLDLEMVPDHVHLLIALHPSVPLSRFVRILKVRSRRLLRQEAGHLCHRPHRWTGSWFASSVGGAPYDVDHRYLENQKRVA